MSRVDTVLPADSVEFCSSPDSTNIFVVGTYKLEEVYEADPNMQNLTSSSSRPHRWGGCLVYEADEVNDQCIQLQKIAMPAVLDMKWASSILAIADAEGHIVLHRWQNIGQRRLEHLQTLACNSDRLDLICLSLDWAKNRNEQHSDKISASLSDGSIVIVRRSDSGMIVTDTWMGHKFEPWITAWDRWDQNIVYTGGDDCTLKGWDLRAGFDQPAFQQARFDAGVTTIQSNPHVQHTLAVGSYDSTVRLIDVRQPLKILEQAQVGGGAWRVKWHPEPQRKYDLLVACMHDGFKVVRFDSLGSKSPSWCISSRYDEHESLAYGVDWSYSTANTKGTLVASSSFYDHSLHLWRA